MKFNYWLKISLSFFIISLVISIKQVNQFFYNLNLNGKSDLFLTLAGINGAFFAIFFSIILIAVQHSASNYLPSILNKFHKDFKLIFIVILSLFGTLFTLFIYSSEIYSLTILGVILFSINFLAIIFYFYEILNFVNPLFMVESKKEEILKKIKLNKEKTFKQVKKELKETFLGRTIPLDTAYEAKLNSKEYTGKNIEFVNELFNHIERSMAINDPETYKKSLESLSEVIEYYLSIKKIDLASDAFISHVLTKLKLQADILLKNNDHFKIIEIIKTLEKIGRSSISNLKTLNFNGINYTSSLVCYYITEIGKKSIILKDLDLVVESIISLENIGFISIEKNLSTTMIESKIKELSESSRDWFVYNHSLDSIGKLLIHLIENIPKKENLQKILPQQDLHLLIKYQSEIFNSAIKTYGNYLEVSGAVSPFLGLLSEVRLSKIISKILWLSQNPPKEIATHNFESISKTALKEILDCHKEIVKETKKYKANIVLMDYKTEFLGSLKELEQTKLKTYKDGFDEEIEIVKDILKNLK